MTELDQALQGVGPFHEELAYAFAGMGLSPRIEQMAVLYMLVAMDLGKQVTHALPGLRSDLGSDVHRMVLSVSAKAISDLITPAEAETLMQDIPVGVLAELPPLPEDLPAEHARRTLLVAAIMRLAHEAEAAISVPAAEAEA